MKKCKVRKEIEKGWNSRYYRGADERSGWLRFDYVLFKMCENCPNYDDEECPSGSPQMLNITGYFAGSPAPGEEPDVIVIYRNYHGIME